MAIRSGDQGFDRRGGVAAGPAAAASEDDPPSRWWIIPLALIPSLAVLFVALVVLAPRSWASARLALAAGVGVMTYLGMLQATGIDRRARTLRDLRLDAALVAILVVVRVLAEVIAPIRVDELLYGVGFPVVFLVAAVADVRAPLPPELLDGRPAAPRRWFGPRPAPVAIVLLTVIPTLAMVAAELVLIATSPGHDWPTGAAVCGFAAYTGVAEDLGLMDRSRVRRQLLVLAAMFGIVILASTAVASFSDLRIAQTSLIAWPVAFLVLACLQVGLRQQKTGTP